MIENKNQPTYPVSEEETDRIDEGVHIYTGLTKREYFAGLAMQGYVGGEFTAQSGMPFENMAKFAVEMADALLEELSKPRQNAD